MTTPVAAPPSWGARRVGLSSAVGERENGASKGDRAAAPIAGRLNGASKGDRAAAPIVGRLNGAPRGDRAAAPIAGRLNGASKGDRAAASIVGRANDRAAGLHVEAMLADPAAVRRSARALHAACAELLPGYAAASREPWRQALLTAGCLDASPRRASPRSEASPLIVDDVVQPSDVLCALWLARRCGHFYPGSPCGDGVGLRSAREIVPSFAVFVTEERRSGVLETLRANTAWRAHVRARAAT